MPVLRIEKLHWHKSLGTKPCESGGFCFGALDAFELSVRRRMESKGNEQEYLQTGQLHLP